MNRDAFWPTVVDSYWAFESDHACLRDGDEQARYEDVLRRLQGMTTSNVMGLLNAACRMLGEDEYYLELGTYRGSTLIGALLDNDAKALAVDNWSNDSPDGKNNRAEFESNIRFFNVADRVVESYAMDIADVLRSDPYGRCGVVFVDGNHQDAADTRRTLDALIPWLADSAVILMDDANMEKIHEAAYTWAAETPGVSLLCDRRTPAHMHQSFWNGIIILGWRKP